MAMTQRRTPPFSGKVSRYVEKRRGEPLRVIGGRARDLFMMDRVRRTAFFFFAFGYQVVADEINSRAKLYPADHSDSGILSSGRNNLFPLERLVPHSQLGKK